MTKKGLTRQQREHLRQIVLDCTLRRLSTIEALDLIRQKLHISIAERYFYTVKKNMVDAAGEQVNYLMQNRNAYLSEYFERIAEQRKFQREVWELYYAAKADNDRNLQLTCIKQLQDISVYLTDLYSLIPNITGLQFESKPVEEEQHTINKHINGFSKDCKVCIEGHRPNYENDPEFQV